MTAKIDNHSGKNMHFLFIKVIDNGKGIDKDILP